MLRFLFYGACIYVVSVAFERCLVCCILHFINNNVTHLHSFLSLSHFLTIVSIGCIGKSIGKNACMCLFTPL